MESLTPLIGEGISRFSLRDELESYHDLLDNFFSITHYQVAYLDDKFNFIRVNPAYAKSGGHKIGYFAGKNHFKLFPNKENEKIFKDVLTTGKPYTAYAKPFKYHDQPEKGTTYWDWSLYPIKDANGKVKRLLLILIDVTEHNRVIERLLEAYQHIGMINRQVSILLEVNKQLTAGDQKVIIKMILNSARTVARAQFSGAYLYNPEDEYFELLSASGVSKETKDEIRTIPVKENKSLMPLFEGRKIHSLIDELNLKGIKPSGRINRILILPIMFNNELKGVLVLGSTSKQEYTQEEINLLDVFTHQASNALHNLEIL